MDYFLSVALKNLRSAEGSQGIIRGCWYDLAHLLFARDSCDQIVKKMLQDVVVGMDVDPLATCIHDHECEGGKSSVVACEDCEHIGRIIKEHISGMFGGKITKCSKPLSDDLHLLSRS